MLALRTTNQFKRDVKKASTQGQSLDDLAAVIESLQQGHALDAKYRDHGLSGSWKDHRECHVGPDWLLIYKTTEDELRLARLGSHSELFG